MENAGDDAEINLGGPDDGAQGDGYARADQNA